MKKQEAKNKKSLDEEQRAIHESYQILLNEYFNRKAYREKIQTEKIVKLMKNDEPEEENLLKKIPKLLISQSDPSTISTETGEKVGTEVFVQKMGKGDHTKD